MANIISNFLRKRIIFVSTAIAVFCITTAAVAYMRPANPTMDYVPQNLGIYDTYYVNFKEYDCRACHGTTTSWRHHATQWAVSQQCSATCHLEPYNPVEGPIIRDCRECHVDGTWVPIDIGRGVGNLGNPHHNTDMAGAGRCTACHSSQLVSDLNSIPEPQFAPTDITPTPFSCENCHWPSGLAPEGSPPLNDWNLWVSYPRPTTWPDGLPHPAPIEANGLVSTGSVVAGDQAPTANKPFRPTTGTHHEIDGRVVAGHCESCHATSPGGIYIIDSTDPLLIRGCENCHDIYTLHGELGGTIGPLNGEHTGDGIGGLGLGGYTVGGALNKVVLGNQKCVACHGNTVTKPMPVDPGYAPDIDHLEPPMGSTGIKVTIVAGAHDFGVKQADDLVVMQQGAGDYISLSVISWNPDKIQVVVPGGQFAAGKAYIRVVKRYLVEVLGDGIGNEDGICDPGENCALSQRASSSTFFIMRQHPILTSLVPDSGTWGTTITINALPNSFFTHREEVFNGPYSHDFYPAKWSGYGYSTYVELVASADKYRVTSMTDSGWSWDTSNLGSWSDTAVKIHLDRITVGGNIVGNLLDVNTNNPAPLADLYKGNWQLYVVTDYFKDAGVAGQYMLHQGNDPTKHLLGKIDPADTLLYREVSDPLPWFAAGTPYISYVSPTSVKGGNLFAIYGANFGITQDTSYVEAGPCSPFVPTYIFPGTPPSAQVYQWSNTRIVLRAPTVGSNKTGCLRVNIPKVRQTSNVSAPVTVHP